MVAKVQPQFVLFKRRASLPTVAKKRDLQEHSPVGEHVAKRLSSLQANSVSVFAFVRSSITISRHSAQDDRLNRVRR